MTSIRAGQRGNSDGTASKTKRYVLAFVMSRPALKPSQTTIRRVAWPGIPVSGVKRPSRQANHSIPTRVKVRNARSYTSIPLTSNISTVSTRDFTCNTVLLLIKTYVGNIIHFFISTNFSSWHRRPYRPDRQRSLRPPTGFNPFFPFQSSLFLYKCSCVWHKRTSQILLTYMHPD